jgi:SOS-response transcriptional repressor LexA
MEEAADQFGLSRSGYVKLERGERELTASHIATAARVYGVPPARVLGEATLDPVEKSLPEKPQFAGFVQAGKFLAVDEYFNQDDVIIPDDVVRRGEYGKVRQYTYQVRGDSLNAEGIEDGSWIVAADASDFIDTYGDIGSGTLVVVERTRAQGAERELTVKEIRFYRDRYELHPRSTNPEHEPIVVPHNHRADDGTEIKIVGVLLSATKVFSPRR